MTPPYIEQTKLPGLAIFYPHKAQDDRGWFRKIYQADFLEKSGWDFRAAETYCHKTKKGVIRGLDFSLLPNEKKMIYCLDGKCQCVYVCVKQGAYQGKFVSIELNGDDPKIILVSSGFCTAALAKTDIIMVNSNSIPYRSEINFKIDPYDQELSIPWSAPTVTWRRGGAGRGHTTGGDQGQ
ncbi:MAG: dTDP-4-dehydrorhamnose 3,5-epimerase family protein, partial [Helicobacteraceae bacterium]|nr:dTDP-4-dehydrorhamnose 3,5-epimerase family protein [Helicobacteraceae bacterium]